MFTFRCLIRALHTLDACHVLQNSSEKLSELQLVLVPFPCQLSFWAGWQAGNFDILRKTRRFIFAKWALCFPTAGKSAAFEVEIEPKLVQEMRIWGRK